MACIFVFKEAMSECAFIGVPFQDEARRRREAVLVERDGESGRADRADERPAENFSRAGRRRFDDEAQGRRRRLGLR
jgi:hypothetical protein